MAFGSARKNSMTLYSDTQDAYSHRVRFAIQEKNLACDYININNPKFKEELAMYNPYGSAPTLVDRDLVLYNSIIIMEYLDERFPHPPLMPAYPVARSKIRLMVYRINKDWYYGMNKILADKASEEATKARKDLTDSIMSVAPVFAEFPFFLSEEFSLADCCIVPLLWRLPLLGIELPVQAKPIIEYSKKMFARESFINSLSEEEKAMNSGLA